MAGLGGFYNGDAFVYIPPFPFSGEVETYNFLFALEQWKEAEKVNLCSSKRTMTIINANDRFS